MKKLSEHVHVLPVSEITEILDELITCRNNIEQLVVLVIRKDGLPALLANTEDVYHLIGKLESLKHELLVSVEEEQFIHAGDDGDAS